MKKLKALFSSIIITLFVLNNLMTIITYAADDTSTGNTAGTSGQTEATQESTEQEEIGRVYEIKEEKTWDLSLYGDGSVVAKWTLEDRTITISGNGDMKSGYNNQYMKIVEKVVIENGITSIGDSTFYNCSSLKNIEISNSVTSIGESAFYGCSSLTNIAIPNSVTSIGRYAFEGCSSLRNIEISNSVTSIGESAFYGCSSLTNIAIPNSVTSIGRYAFEGCSSLTNIEIPSSVTNIGDYAFRECSSLTNIEIPSSVTNIGDYAFKGCSSLTNIEVDSDNNTYTSIEGVLFNKDKKKIIRYPEGKQNSSYIIPNGVTSIGDDVFRECSSLTNIEIPSSVTNIGDYAFKGCSSLTNIEIPSSVTNIGDYAFEGCSSLTNIEIPNNVTSILNYAFNECSSLTNIEIPNSVTSIGKEAFYGCNSLTNIEVPNSVTSIGNKAFRNIKGPIICKTNSEAHRYAEDDKIGYILLDNTISNYNTDYRIKDEETWDISANGDKSVTAKWTLNNRTLTISGSGEMKDWTSSKAEDWHNTKYTKVIEKVVIDNGVTSIGEYAFYGCSSLTNIEIPNSVTSIGKYAFYECSSLTNIEIPNSVTFISYLAFYRCSSLKEINVDSNNQQYSSTDGILFNKNKTKILKYPPKKEASNYVIPNSVTSIESYAFDGCSSLTNIEIQNGVTSIGTWVFYECSSLTNIEIPDSVTSINNYAFWKCSSLTNIEIPNSVTSIGNEAFEYCSSLINIEIPNSVTTIGSYVFNGCSSLKNIVIPNSVTSIASGTFGDCSSLTNIEIPNSVTSIGGYAFRDCSSLKIIVIPNSVTSIGDEAFWFCSSLTNIVIPSSVTSIGNNAFHIKGPIICKANSEAHRFSESGGIGYILDEESPEVEFTPSEFNKAQKQVSIKVDVSDNLSGVNEDSLKYLWSTKTEVSKDEFETSFANASQINSPENATGTYYLYIYAEDKVGNEVVAKSNAIQLDNIPPQIKGVVNGKIYFGKAKPTITDENTFEVELIKDGNKVSTYTNGAEITEIGKYKLTATDEAGNVTEVEFEIEKIPDGQDGINYVLEPSELTNQNVKVTLSKKDATKYADLKIQVSTDGENYEDGTEKTLEQNGKIYARYAIDELVGVPLEINVTNIDKTAPETEVTYSTTELTKENIIATITANEKVQSIDGWTKSADEKVLTKEYEQNTAIGGEKIVVKDLVGNETETIVKIANIDKDAPTVTGVQNGRNYAKKATPLVEDENLESVILVKKEKKQNEETNEEEIIETEVEGYKNGDTITELGDYKLTATDKIGHITIVEFSIKEIPDTKDVVVVTKSTEEMTNQDVVVTITKKDGEEYEGLKIEVSTDNENYEEQETNPSTKTLTENGKIYVRVVKEDIIGEVLEVVVNNIDKTAPTATITYSPTELTKENVIATITANEKIQQVSGWTLSEDGLKLTKTYTQNTATNGEEIIIKDLAGNETKGTIKIANIDKTAPTATITYSNTNPTNQDVVATITANEKVQQVSGWTLSSDGLKLTKIYTANTTTNGEEIAIKDLVGNETKKTIKIANIDKQAPIITGVEKNHRYFRKAKPEITEENIKTIELLRSGRQVEDYTNGQEIANPGDYRLTATDKAGNSTAINFSIYDIETKDYKEQTIGNTNYLGKINVGSKTSQIEKLLKSVENFKITRNGAEIYSNTNRSNDQVLATGDKIEFEDQEYTLIVTGDINKDGKSNIVDLARCMKVVLGKKQLDTIEGFAADTNFDGKVNIIDLAKIRKLSLNN